MLHSNPMQCWNRTNLKLIFCVANIAPSCPGKKTGLYVLEFRLWLSQQLCAALSVNVILMTSFFFQIIECRLTLGIQCTVHVKEMCPKSRVATEYLRSKYYAYTLHACELLLKIMAVLATVSTLHEQLPSVIVDLSLYYCCTAHQPALRSLCTKGCA